MTQHHEALHHHFNVLTTTGNALQLLRLLSDKSPTPSIAAEATKLANAWSEALAEPLEGVICYVSYQRTRRRMDLPSSRDVRRRLPRAYAREWQRNEALYETLGLAAGSPDAVAMHVAHFVLNVPVYSSLRDLPGLPAAAGLVTRAIMSHRCSAVSDLLCSNSGRAFLERWDADCERIWKSSGTTAEKQNKESSSIEDWLRSSLPNVESEGQHHVPQSVELAWAWSQQLDIDIALQRGEDFLNSIESVVIAPPAPKTSELYPLDRQLLEVINVRLEIQPDLRCVAIFHLHNRGRFLLSNRYRRTLNKGDLYLRLHVAHAEDLHDVRIEEHAFFSILRLQDLPDLLPYMRHARFLLTESATSAPILGELSNLAKAHWSRLCRIHWGVTLQHIETSLHEARTNAWFNLGLTKSHVGLLVLRRAELPFVEMYPHPWDVIERVAAIARAKCGHADTSFWTSTKDVMAVWAVVKNLGF